MTNPDRFLLAGLMGWPVMHSRSPPIHNYWLAQHGIAGTYVPLAIRPEGLAATGGSWSRIYFSNGIKIQKKE